MYQAAEKYGDDEGGKLLSYKVSLAFIAAAAICNCISFVSPFWIVAKNGNNQGFVKLGLWEACFDQFVFPDDYVSKAYRDCWYIYYPEYKYISYWLNPSWFYCVQILSIITLICNLLALLVYSLKLCQILKSQDQNTNRLVIGCQIIAGAGFTIMVILVGCYSKDREWMPRPDHNRVSWSFALAVFAGFFSIMSSVALITNYIAWQSRFLYSKFENQIAKEIAIKGGSVFNAHTDPMHGPAKTESHLPSLFRSGFHGYGVPSHISAGYLPGSVSGLDAQGKTTGIATSGANVSSKLREAYEAHRAAKESVINASVIHPGGSHVSIPTSPPSQYGTLSKPLLNITMDTTV